MIDDKALLGHWHVVGLSSDLGDEPLQVELMGEKVVLWRPNGRQDTEIQAFRDLCIHRGTALSLGKIEDGCLVCPYHGWRYDTSGQCVHIPAQGDQQNIPEKARATSYTATERYNLIWLSLDTPQHDIPNYAEFEEAGFKTITCGPYSIDAQAPRVIENFLDVSHLMWVHEGLLGVPSHAVIPEYHVHEQNNKLVTDTIRIFQPDPDGRGKVVNNDYIYSVLSPMTAHFRKTDSTSPEVFSMMLQTSPVADGKTKAYILLSRNYAFETEDATFQAFQDKVFSQDEVIVQSQRPELLPLDLREELHLMSDRLAIAYRRYLDSQGVRTGVA